jgi:hypothetical protein
MKSNLIISPFTLGAVNIASLRTATADVRWRYPYKSTPYAIPHTHTGKIMHDGTAVMHPRHHMS